VFFGIFRHRLTRVSSINLRRTGGGTRTTALRLHRRRLRWRPSHAQEHIWTHLHSGMRTCELCPRLVFAQTNSRFSFNHRSGTLRCWTWRYRRHLGKIAANRTENDSAMQWLTIPITIQTDSQSAKALAEGSGYTGGLRHVAVQFRSRPIRSRLVEFEWIRSKINLLTCWVSQVLHSTQ